MTATPTEVEALHQRADTDSSSFAIHHTIGKKKNQAAAGDHNHDNKYAPIGGGGGGGGAPTGPAGGDLSGTYPNPSIANNSINSAKIQDGTVTATDLAPGTIPTTLPPNGAAGGDLTGTYPNPTVGTGKITSAKILNGTIVDADVAAANIDGLVAVPSLRTLGTGAQQAMPGNTVIPSIPSALPPNGPAGGELAGTYPNPTIADNVIDSANIIDGTIVAADLASNSVTNVKIAASAVTTGKIADGTITDVDVNPANVDGVAATASLRTLGTGAQQALPGNTTILKIFALSIGTAFTAGVEKTVTHNLGTTFIQVGFTINSSSQEVRLQWRILSSNAIGVKSDVAWGASQISVTVMG